MVYLRLFLILFSFVYPVRCHSYVKYIISGDQNISTWLPFEDPWKKANGPKPTRRFLNNAPVKDVNSDLVTCNFDKEDAVPGPAPTHFSVAAGSTLDLYWAKYPIGHKGPVLTYLAKCDDTCETFTIPKDKKIWFKIDEGGFYGDGSGATTEIYNTGAWHNVKIPPTLQAGHYLLRHEAIALHAALKPGGAQLFMQCHQVEITGGSGELPSNEYLVSFPGAYDPNDPGLVLSIYYPKVKNYTIPGPPVWQGNSAHEAQLDEVHSFNASDPSNGSALSSGIPSEASSRASDSYTRDDEPFYHSADLNGPASSNAFKLKSVDALFLFCLASTFLWAGVCTS